jgi:hypothetical protein
MSSLQFYYKDQPFYLKTNNYFTVGYINANNQLIDITTSTDLVITIKEGTSIVSRNAGNYNVIILNSNSAAQSVYLKLVYTDPDDDSITILYQSLALVQPFLSMNPQRLLRIYNQLLPSFYTREPKSNQANESKAIMAQLFALYDNSKITTKVGTTDVPNAVFKDLNTIRGNIYPSGGSTAWEQYLNNTNNMSNSFNYGLLLRLLYRVAMNNDNNAYYYAKNISEYIYQRLGYNYYALISQHITDYTGAFILDNNSLGECYLSPVSDDVNALAFKVYILYATDPDELPVNPDAPNFTDDFKAELNTFIVKLTPSHLKVTVDYTYTLNQAINEFGLTYLSYTYLGDPRQASTVCIQYTPDRLTETLGYGGSLGNIGYITNFELNINNGGVVINGDDITVQISANEDYEITTTPIYTISPGTVILDNINNFMQFYSDDKIEAAFGYLDNLIETLTSGSAGTYTGRAYLGRIMKNLTIEVT